jgi:hypothetical protein
MFFEDNPSRLRNGLFREDAYWDCKADCPSMRKKNDLALAVWSAFLEGPSRLETA